MATNIPPAARSFLEALAGPESAGAYDVIYGGGKFSDFTDHPRQAVTITSGPNKGRKSTAAGKYQFLGSTWDDQAGRLGLTDFSPANQDAAAWNLASETYKAKTGRELLADLEAGDTSRVASALKDQWTSLPGGIEQSASSKFGKGKALPASTGNALAPRNALTALSTPSGAQPNALARIPFMAPPEVTFEPLTLPTRRRA